MKLLPTLKFQGDMVVCTMFSLLFYLMRPIPFGLLGYIINNYLIIAKYVSTYSYILNSITTDSVSPGSAGTYTMSSSWSVSTPVSPPTLTQSDGNNLPSWIIYNSSTDVMTWTAPANNSLTQLLLLYWVTDTTYTSLTGKLNCI